jgi:hypothetical protein
MPSLRGTVCLLLISLAGCRQRNADLGMSDTAFVQVMGELKFIADAPDVTDEVRAQRRDAVLRKQGVSAAQLEKLSGTLTLHPQHARRLWAAIDLKAFNLSQKKKPR